MLFDREGISDYFSEIWKRREVTWKRDNLSMPDLAHHLGLFVETRGSIKTQGICKKIAYNNVRMAAPKVNVFCLDIYYLTLFTQLESCFFILVHFPPFS